MDLDFVSVHKNAKRELGQYPAILTSRLVNNRAVFKWLSKVITWLRLLRLVIGLKDSRQFFNQWDAKPKPIAPSTRDFSRASSELQVIARNCDWLMELFVPVMIGRSNCFGFGFSTVIWKSLYIHNDIHPFISVDVMKCLPDNKLNQKFNRVVANEAPKRDTITSYDTYTK